MGPRIAWIVWLAGAVAAVPALAAEPSGADAPAREPRATVWDAWGEARLRGIGATQFIEDDNGRKLDQGAWMMSRLIAGGRWWFSPKLETAVELEVLNGFAAGDSTDLGKVLTERPFPVPRDDNGDLKRVVPRKAYVAWTTDYGRFTAGTQTFLWGTGMLANDGAGDPAFGDPWLGNVVARLSYSLRPLETAAIPQLFRKTAFFIAADASIRDDNASLYDGDEAFSGLVGARALDGGDALGVLFIVRDQEDREDDVRTDGRLSHTTVGIVDLHGKKTWELDDVQRVSLEAEGAIVFGNSTRPWSDATFDEDSDVLQLGGLARLRWDHDALRLSAHLETGYASGDNDPRDNVSRTFTMHTDHNVGLVLFDHVLPLLTAHSADRLGDPGLSAVAPPSTRFAINPGGVQNAIYLNPVVRWRPLSPLEMRFGYLFAAAAADVIDPYQTAINGGFPTNAGGIVGRRGVYGNEFDVRATWDHPMPRRALLRAGVEGGVLLPGSAFDDVPGLRPEDGGMDEIWLGRLMLSLLW